MTKGNLIFTDVLFALSITLMLIGTQGRFTLSAVAIVVIALGYSFFKHVGYFRATKRIY